MKKSSKISLSLTAAVAALVMASGAHAQSTTRAGSSGGYSLMSPGSSYLGFNVGQSAYRLNNGAGGFSSQDGRTSYNLYGGSYFSEFFGAEIGYNDFGRIDRAGGSTSANGLSLSLVARLPVATSVNLLARLGTTYSRTDVSSRPVSGITPGNERSWGTSYGVGAEYLFNPNWSAVLQYDEYRAKFAGTGREKINVTSLGVRYAF